MISLQTADFVGPLPTLGEFFNRRPRAKALNGQKSNQSRRPPPPARPSSARKPIFSPSTMRVMGNSDNGRGGDDGGDHGRRVVFSAHCMQVTPSVWPARALASTQGQIRRHFSPRHPPCLAFEDSGAMRPGGTPFEDQQHDGRNAKCRPAPADSRWCRHPPQMGRRHRRVALTNDHRTRSPPNSAPNTLATRPIFQSRGGYF